MNLLSLSPIITKWLKGNQTILSKLSRVAQSLSWCLKIIFSATVKHIHSNDSMPRLVTFSREVVFLPMRHASILSWVITWAMKIYSSTVLDELHQIWDTIRLTQAESCSKCQRVQLCPRLTLDLGISKMKSKSSTMTITIPSISNLDETLSKQHNASD